MSRIPLTGGFTLMAEGIQILKVTKVDYEEDFGKLSITMENSRGEKHFERYRLLLNDGGVNDKAINAFSSLAKAILGNVDDCDPEELLGGVVKAQIAHRTYEDSDGNERKTTTKVQGTYWETPSDEEAAAAFSGSSDEKAKEKPKVDLNALLGRS